MYFCQRVELFSYIPRRDSQLSSVSLVIISIMMPYSSSSENEQVGSYVQPSAGTPHGERRLPALAGGFPGGPLGACAPAHSSYHAHYLPVGRLTDAPGGASLSGGGSRASSAAMLPRWASAIPLPTVPDAPLRFQGVEPENIVAYVSPALFTAPFRWLGHNICAFAQREGCSSMVVGALKCDQKCAQWGRRRVILHVQL